MLKKLRFCAALFSAGMTLTGLLPLACAAEADESSETENGKIYTSGDYTYSLMSNENDDTLKAACIESYTGTETDLVIPGQIDGMDVVALGSYAFTSMAALEKVTLPKTVIQFGEYAFADCPSIQEYAVEDGNPLFEAKDGVLYSENGETLTRYPVGKAPEKLTVPDGVVEIGNVAFTGCSSLKSITFPDSLLYIDLSAFAECTGLTEVELPEKLTEIGAFSFNSCSNLKSVTFPDTLQTIGNAAFAATALESVILPDGLVQIGQQAFCETKLKNVLIPASVTDIGFCAFGWGVSQTGELVIDKSFVISGTAGSVAEEYAGDADSGNSFKFIAIDDGKPDAEEGGLVDNHDHDHDEALDSAADTDTEKQQQNGVSGAVRVIGIAVCIVLILIILAVALLAGKHKPKKADESPKDTAEQNPDAPDADPAGEEAPQDEA